MYIYSVCVFTDLTNVSYEHIARENLSIDIAIAL